MNDGFDDRADRLAASAKEVLDQSLNDLGRETTIRLQRARLRALDGASRPRPWLVWAGGAVLASAAILMAILWSGPLTNENRGHLPLLEDLELVTSPENVDISEDLEFYDWLADATSTTG
ncbi:MAG TPA: hypothetical protein VFQ34_01490 [Nitrospiraceae bacterium]|jgi:hypothetical protein|nr:hypothetical protein [Nitrospiraceae bacterium]